MLKPSRSDGNVRLYTDEDVEQLELILNLTRDLGVNLAGVEIILNMREKMDQMQQEFNRFFGMLRD
ncbi:MAG: chaperone modulator CbpM [Blastocatellia bacterium]